MLVVEVLGVFVNTEGFSAGRKTRTGCLHTLSEFSSHGVCAWKSAAESRQRPGSGATLAVVVSGTLGPTWDSVV